VKRFLTSMLLRHKTAVARGFGSAFQLNVLAKLMLAERFQPRLFEQIERSAARSSSGICHEFDKLEMLLKSPPPRNDGETRNGAGTDLVSTWLESEEVCSWARLKPSLSATDLRPYLFITRDRKRAIVSVTVLGSLEALVRKLLGPQASVAGLASDIRKLSQQEQDRVFDSLREHIQNADSLATPPPGIFGMRLMAETDARFAPGLLDVLSSLPGDHLGAWVASGWTTAFQGDDRGIRQLMERWSNSKSNAKLASVIKATLKVTKPAARAKK
jgi:hypothetical protein